MPSYTDNDPKGWCGDPSRGAAMGRTSYHTDSQTFTGRLYLRRVRLDSGGYDPNGTYFGTGAPLFWCASDCGEIDFVLRGASREVAKREVAKRYPSARFFR